MDLATLRDVLSLRMGTSVAGQIRKRVPDGRVAQMLDHFVQYVGSSPYASPAVLCSIAHMQTDGGVWYPMGGTRAVPEALERLAGELGVDLRPGTDVTRILQEDGRAAGVVTDAGETIRLSRRGLQHGQRAHLSRTGRRRAGPELRQALEARAGLFRRGAVSRARPRATSTSRTTISSSPRDPEEEFDWIYGKGEPAPDPTCYLAATARTEPGVAPPGGEALYVLVHTPYLRPHHDWSAMFRPVSAGDPGQAEALRRHAGPGGADRVRAASDAAGHPRPLPRAERRHLRAGQPRQGQRRVQAGQPVARSAGAVSGRRRGASGAGHADGADERLDRGGQPQPGFASAEAARVRA